MVGIDMAIIIPSSKTYDRQNPKVRDNVIERIEIETNTVVPDNKYETPIYNEQIKNLTFEMQETTNEDLQETYLINTGAGLYVGACAYVGYNSQKYSEHKIYIQKSKNNSFISKLLLGEDDNNNQNIKTSFVGTKNEGSTSGVWYGDFNTSGKNDLTVKKGEIQYSSPLITKLDERYEIPKEITYAYESQNRGTPIATTNLIDIGNLSTVGFGNEIINNIDYYTLHLKIMCGVRIVYMGGEDAPEAAGAVVTNCPFIMNGTYEEYIPHTIEITINGNTIGIDLTDNVVKIGDDTSKKVQSFERNELMQTQNYTIVKTQKVELTYGSPYTEYGQYTYTFLDSDGLPTDSSSATSIEVKVHDQEYIGSDIIVKFWEYDSPESIELERKFENSNGYCYINHGYYLDIEKGIEVYAIKNKQISAIEKMYGETKDDYIRGKETATIRCSIGDYYDESIQKVISTDNSTGKMSFDLYDQVIPMVYGANGQDLPMSLCKDGTPKVFQVLGKKVFYDGAVWQELTLQEI